MASVIRLEHLRKEFEGSQGSVFAVRDVSLQVDKGDIFGIIGLSGAGKSTLVRCMNLLERPTSGKVWFYGKELTAMKESQLRWERKHIGMIFQHFNLLQQRTVLDNVCFPMELDGVRKSKAREKALEYLRIVGLEDKKKAYPAQLSGGQKQRVAIARVLASQPKLLLCDEATSALDPQTTSSILQLIKDINRSMGITVIVITHEMSVVQAICNRVAVLEQGEVVETGKTGEVFRNPKSQAAKRLILPGLQTVERMESGRLVRITFDGQSAFEPVVANLILEFKTPVNILYADTKELDGKAVGEMVLQLPQDSGLAGRMISHLRERGLGVSEEEQEEKGLSAGRSL